MNRMVKFKGLLLLFILFLLQCEVPFENNARLLIKGQIVDENNQPISNSQINVFVRRGENFLYNSDPSNEDSGVLLGATTSDIDGTFSLITLLGKDEDFVIEVYGGEDFSKYMYRTNTEAYIPDDYLIDLETISLPKKAFFEFNIIRSSPAGTELQYNFNYTSIPCLEVYEDGVLNEVETSCYKQMNRSRFLDDERPDASGDFLSFLGANVIFTYSINDQPEVVEVLTIDDINFEFNFNY